MDKRARRAGRTEPAPGHRIFLLSPALCHGERAKLLLGERGKSPLALHLRSGGKAALGEVFTFVSGLYFRAKLAYASAFASPPPHCEGTLVITPDRGLLPPGTMIGLDELRAFAGIDIAHRDPRFLHPFRRDASALAIRAGAGCRIVLLGSLAPRKYLDVLFDGLADRLHYPSDFVGKGDMVRGCILLAAVREMSELPYAPASERSAPLPSRSGSA
ncbi:MAG: hypothetical protein AB1640_03110 [bacterium]